MKKAMSLLTATAMAAILTGFILSQRAAFVNSFDRAVFCCPERSDT